MKFTINRNLFIENLSNAEQSHQELLFQFLVVLELVLTEDELTLTGSDTDISIEIQIQVNEDLNVESTGSIVLPARFFSEIVKKLPGKIFLLKLRKASKTQIISENGEFTINGLDANNYPRLPEIPDAASFTISGKTFREIINETQFATSNDQTRAILTGVRFFLTILRPLLRIHTVYHKEALL